ncbi:MAG: ECF transporter S component [Bacilli bacterium]
MLLSAFFDYLNREEFKYTITVVFVALLLFLVVYSYSKERRTQSRSIVIRRLVIVSIFSSISILLYIFGIDINIFIPFMPPFLEIHFSIIPILLITSLYGPAYGGIAIIIKTLGKLILVTSSSFGVGEIADIFIGVSVVTVFAFLYYKKESSKNLIIALIVSGVVWIMAGVFINWSIIIPFYIYVWNFEAVFAALKMIPGITEANYMGIYLLGACLPFNAIAASLNMFLSYFVIRSLSRIIPQIGTLKNN